MRDKRRIKDENEEKHIEAKANEEGATKEVKEAQIKPTEFEAHMVVLIFWGLVSIAIMAWGNSTIAWFMIGFTILRATPWMTRVFLRK